MGKILFWFVVIVVVLFGARLLSHKAGNTKSPRPKGKQDIAADMSDAEAMVRCEHCGIHMPRSEAVLIDGHTWCGQEHARLGQRKT